MRSVQSESLADFLRDSVWNSLATFPRGTGETYWEKNPFKNLWKQSEKPRKKHLFKKT